jgi:hypothetical protein
MKINPIIILNIILIIFLSISIAAAVMMVKNEMSAFYTLASSLTGSFLIFILYIINKRTPSSVLSDKTHDLHQYKAKLAYHQNSFTIASYSQDIIISWNSIEAIFLINAQPLDGEYHHKEYRIFLNTEPETIRKRPLSWYHKILPEPKKEQFPMIKIDDYYNIDFETFYPSAERFLMDKNTVSYFRENKNKLITSGFQIIFDKGTPTDNGLLKDYRIQTVKKISP